MSLEINVSTILDTVLHIAIYAKLLENDTTNSLTVPCINDLPCMLL